MIQKPVLSGYAILTHLGEGGSANVWKALEIKSGQTVALKVLNRDLSTNQEDIENFQAEHAAMSKIDHPGIVRSFRLERQNGIWFYVMEYVDGYNFQTLLARKNHLPESDCLLLAESVATALDYAWNDYGVVHCDIKPENLMINTDGVVKITDLGLCHVFHYIDGFMTAPDHVHGTPAYISPEQVFGDIELDCRADIYSLGATLYHFATGRFLFPLLDNEATLKAHCDPNTRAKDPRCYQPSLSEGFAQLLEAMLVKDRTHRIASWKDVYAMCREIETGATFKPRCDPSPSSISLN